MEGGDIFIGENIIPTFMRLFKNKLRINAKAFLAYKVLQHFHQNANLMKMGMVVGGLYFSSLWYFKNMSL
jgi:hypothetical protein